MTCPEARELLLEAEVAELRGEGTSALVLHLAECAECRRAAQHLLEMNRRLNAALESAPRTRVPAPGLRPLYWGLAAAATVALVVAVRARQGVGRREPPAAVAATPEPVLEVSAGTGRTAAVFRTADPKITVVWFF
jgi:predicted anti-sigma-YlaC factor YlaD